MGCSCTALNSKLMKIIYDKQKHDFKGLTSSKAGQDRAGSLFNCLGQQRWSCALTSLEKQYPFVQSNNSGI